MPSYPPGPPGLPLVGSVFTALRDPLELFVDATRTYGDVVGLRMLHLKYVLLSSPDVIRHVLVENHKNYEKSRNYVGLKVILGQGLVTSEGEVWRRQRKLAQPAFHRERIASFVRAMSECTSDMLARWSAEPDAVLDVHKEMMRLTFRIVGRALLSRDLDGDASAIGEALSVGLHWANDYAESLVPVPLAVPTPKNVRMKRAMRTFDALIHRTIAERRAGEPKDDLLSMLLEARDEETGEPMSDALLRDELITMVSAGHETTANALSFALYLLSKHPAWARAVATEADAVLGVRGSTPTIDDVKKLATTQRVVEETMRLYPPVWVFERRALAADRAGDYEIPKDATVGIAPYVLHRSPALWPNPEGFDPTRFEPQAKEARHKYAYIPFGGGPRTCIGNVFALTEATLLLAMIARSFRLELLPGRDLVLDPMVTLRPKGGLPMTLRPRTPPRQAPESSRRSAASAGVTPLG